MNEKDPTKFRIRIDDKIPDTGFEEEIKDRGIEKLSRRITLVSILIPCLIAVILFVAYLDIKKRVGSMHSAGETVSQDLNSRLSLVSEKQAKLEDMLAKKIEVELKEATTAIRYIRSARKVDNKTLKGAIADIEKGLGPVRKDLKNAASGIKALDKNLANLGKELDKAKNDLNKMQADISLLSSAKIDRKALDNVLNSRRKIYEQKLKQITEDLANKVESIRKRIRKIEMSMPSVAVTSKPPPTKKPAEETATPQPGIIIEEDIK
ncbi:MAG: hypothetical protein ISS67_06835 [Desulfobacterales bacterium]|uniref:Uncharacterized protein n=1 Tax=Candidatus Desulfaltia bathyphila TaxID=2841697 RepID=A0A8J6N9R2_9BACT|nr:hypothetical protein [Candidatus Desulfaltia bathyphila]MBL7195381.1 hypothetical protein [Desulfobacterales bacterium]MBL7208216.1 hypothetical protein [Desulfobacterales bacterium]